MPSANAESYHPIIYIRGFAMNKSDIDETTADPFCGFNSGSTVYRARPGATDAARFVFESPVVRLVANHDYVNVISEGMDLSSPTFDEPMPRRSIVIFHYYDPASTLLGNGVVPPIQDFARKLSDLLARLRTLVLKTEGAYATPEQFRCFLVAHSMGGLVARTFLQNPQCDPNNVRTTVKKLFTYATPHNGIEFGGFNVPSFFTSHQIDTFSRPVMGKYFGLVPTWQTQTDDVARCPATPLDPANIFTLIGTNRLDYEVGMGLSRTFVGKGSDGLVRIQNADLKGFTVAADGTQVERPCAKAFVYRSHSGYFGIVNSEEGYQNLQRFLFGDYRVDVWLEVDDIVMPAGDLADADAAGTLEAKYPVDVLISLRNKRWFLTRRVAEEDSSAVLEHSDVRAQRGKTPALEKALSTIFMADWGKLDPQNPTVAYRVQLAVRTPDYQIDGRDATVDHFEGSSIYADAVIVELDTSHVPWTASYWWESEQTSTGAPSTKTPLTLQPLNAGSPTPLVARIAIVGGAGIKFKGALKFIASPWA
ncbi:esterase/lipase family protein [Paraburkholderia sp. BR10936]|uniref:esterase/lipase family protein n=1 Tax=Paraburkholderia sp. BR10936 TaxID=3236993 RepID=UPI0034D20B06